MATSHTVKPPLFTYAVIADTHLNQGEDDCNSPFEVNRLANARLRFIIDDLNSRELSHVIHLGDIVHPVPSMGELYSDSAARFHEQTAQLKHPIFVIPGNHDVGDKPIKWGPAGTVRQSFLDAWQQHFGAHYFKHIHQGVVFIGINAQVLGSGLPLEAEQQSWLQQCLTEHANQRVCLFSHYPPFLFDSEEEEHYDNLSATSRAALLALIREYRIETLFAGHVHHFWYNHYEGCDCYLLPSTCFTRQDYSEMFRVGPAAEHGRNDADKLGYLLVHVYEDSQQIEMVRSFGAQSEESNQQQSTVTRLPFSMPVNATSNPFPAMGFDLRHDWCERVQIPPSGGLDEFNRKWVRNDYGLLALWEMGVRHLRVPAADLVDPERRQRLMELARLGFRFALYSFDKPSVTLVNEVDSCASIFDSWELGFRFAELGTLDLGLLATCRTKGIRLFASPLRSKDEIVSSGKTYYHVINHGLMVTDDLTASDALISQIKQSGLFDGIVLRCSLQDDIQTLFSCASEIARCRWHQPIVHLRMTADSPADNQLDQPLFCNRLAEAMVSQWSFSNIRLYCDSLIDNDRGYFPRSGVLDRRFNPKPGFHLVRALHRLFAWCGPASQFEVDDSHTGQRILHAGNDNRALSVVLFADSTAVNNPAIVRFGERPTQWMDWQSDQLVLEMPDTASGFPLIAISNGH